jgi:hypothetical protein
MRNHAFAGEDSPRTQSTDKQGAVLTAPPADRMIRVGSPVSLLAVVPHLLGFMPGRSLVVIGTEQPKGQVKLALRYDLPDPPAAETIREITEHAAEVLAAQRVEDVLVIGYGPAALVAPLADEFRRATAVYGLALGEILRVQDQRYWSYLCAKPDCCPPEGTPFDLLADPAWATMSGAGHPVLSSRDDLAKTVAALDGAAGEATRRATQRAEAKASTLIARVTRTGRRGQARRLIAAAGISSVAAALATYRRGQRITNADQMAWLTIVLRDLRVRDDAWARMDPKYREPYGRMWTDVTRAARPGYVAAPACLLAFAAWQDGNGALANVALDRAIADQPGYTMAELLRQVIDGGVPPSAARLPMTPEEVAASYDEIDDEGNERD